jgi:hypothetical protein
MGRVWKKTMRHALAWIVLHGLMQGAATAASTPVSRVQATPVKLPQAVTPAEAPHLPAIVTTASLDVVGNPSVHLPANVTTAMIDVTGNPVVHLPTNVTTAMLDVVGNPFVHLPANVTTPALNVVGK